MDRRTLTLALAGSMASALALVTISASADDMMKAPAKEKCYGIALKGQNDCAAGSHSCAGQSTADYDKASFKAVPAGTCKTMKTPHGHGMLAPGKA